MNEHDEDVMIFALLTEAQGLLNRALSHYFRQKNTIHQEMFRLHDDVARLADSYRDKIVEKDSKKG